MFGFSKDKTKKSISDLENIPQTCNSCIDFKYTVYKDVFTRYVITLNKHTANDHYDIVSKVIEMNPPSTKVLDDIDADTLDSALDVFFETCKKYITITSLTEYSK